MDYNFWIDFESMLVFTHRITHKYTENRHLSQQKKKKKKKKKRESGVFKNHHIFKYFIICCAHKNHHIVTQFIICCVHKNLDIVTHFIICCALHFCVHWNVHRRPNVWSLFFQLLIKFNHKGLIKKWLSSVVASRNSIGRLPSIY